MSDARDEQRGKKISDAFAARLARAAPGEQIRAIVLLDIGPVRPKDGERRSAKTRRAAINTIRETASQVLPEIDRIVREHNGRRLGDNVDAFGSLSVEVRVAGIRALAASACVRAVLEDQSISRPPPPRSG